MSNSLWLNGLQHARPPCPTNSQSLLKLMSIKSVMSSNHLILYCPLIPPPSIFSSIRSFSISQFFPSGSQNIGVSASASLLPMNIQEWFPLGWTGGSPCSPRDSQESSPKPQFKSINSSAFSFLYKVFLYKVQLSHPYMTTGKTTALTRWTFCFLTCCLGWS